MAGDEIILRNKQQRHTKNVYRNGKTAKNEQAERK